jgi:hypothetical protein
LVPPQSVSVRIRQSGPVPIAEAEGFASRIQGSTPMKKTSIYHKILFAFFLLANFCVE